MRMKESQARQKLDANPRQQRPTRTSSIRAKPGALQVGLGFKSGFKWLYFFHDFFFVDFFMIFFPQIFNVLAILMGFESRKNH